MHIVSEGYLDAMGLTLVQGRNFSSNDHGSGHRVVLVNQVMARALWPAEDPLGQPLSLARLGEFEVMGVVRGMRYLHPEQDPGPEIFFSLRQVLEFGPMHVIARGTRSPTDLAAALRGALRPLDPRVPLNEIFVVQDLVDQSISPRRFLLLLLSGFAGFALVLAAFGLYGVISLSVSQRTREMGIRSALGASPGKLRQGVLTETLGLAGAGMAVGIGIAWMLGRVLRGLLFGVSSTDPVTFLGVGALVLTVAAVAGYLPATRATRVDPVRAMTPEGSVLA
jgi:hypothetical protein